jgi:hypothetical protein
VRGPSDRLPEAFARLHAGVLALGGKLSDQA